MDNKGDKMKLSILGHNQTEVEHKGTTILFSYNTPVACRTSEGGADTPLKPQSFFDNLTLEHRHNA